MFKAPCQELEMSNLSDAPEHVQLAQIDLSLSIPPDVEPSSDLEWLEREAARLASLGHDAGRAAAELVRGLIREMDGRGVWSIGDLEARRDAEQEDRYQRYLAEQFEVEAAFCGV
jgi:hypothetical protein